MSFVNLGMVELYIRFALKRIEHVITVVEGQTVYDMPADFMYATSAFQKIFENNEFINQDVPLNEEMSYGSVFFPSYNKVQIPEDLKVAEITVIYVPKPVRYTKDDRSLELDLPEVLIDCRLSYLGYKGHLGVRSDGQSENNLHALRFERSIQKVKELGVCPTTDYYRTTNKIGTKGFV